MFGFGFWGEGVAVFGWGGCWGERWVVTGRGDWGEGCEGCLGCGAWWE